jgi:F-type H+-transporting ATPase subunit epsilon
MSIQVEIVTPARIAYSGSCDTAAAPGLLGEFGVLEQHAQMLAVTQAGVVTMSLGDEITKLVVGPGFAEVGPERLTLLVDHCEGVDGIDKDQAKSDLQAAYTELSKHEAESEDGLRARKEADLAQARLQS